MSGPLTIRPTDNRLWLCVQDNNTNLLYNGEGGQAFRLTDLLELEEILRATIAHCRVTELTNQRESGAAQ